MYGYGVSHEGCLVDLGAQYDIIAKSGAWYSYGEHRLGQGKENVKEFLKQNPEVAAEIEAKVRTAAVLTPAPVKEVVEDEQPDIDL